jgi:SAM-dependent methyltransferase
MASYIGRRDYRTRASLRAERRVIDLCDTHVELGLGGRPRRLHPKIVNLNIQRVENVDVVGDAHNLPLRIDCVNAVHCEAVFEHLEHPDRAAAELFRVMKPGALGYVCTPLMQGFHAYPSHFQNFTHVGHKTLFERASFEVLECGTAVGPAWTLASIVAVFIAEYSPRLLRWPLRAGWYVFANVLCPAPRPMA